jgi:hypothetical protein
MIITVEERAGGTVSNYIIISATGKRCVSRRADEKMRKKSVILIGVLSHEQPAAGFNKMCSASTSPSTARLIIRLTDRESVE